MNNTRTDSNGITIKGKHGNGRIWIRTTADGSRVMQSVIGYDAFQYHHNGLYKKVGYLTTKPATLEDCVKFLEKKTSKMEVIPSRA